MQDRPRRDFGAVGAGFDPVPLSPIGGGVHFARAVELEVLILRPDGLSPAVLRSSAIILEDPRPRRSGLAPALWPEAVTIQNHAGQCCPSNVCDGREKDAKIDHVVADAASGHNAGAVNDQGRVGTAVFWCRFQAGADFIAERVADRCWRPVVRCYGSKR